MESSSSLSLYWELASPDASIRHKSAASLIQVLSNFQSQFSTSDEKSKSLSQISQIAEIDALCSPDLAYGLKRLIRGLPSSRDGARLGFAVALSELLKIMPPMHAHVYIDLLMQLTESQSSTKGQEERDIYFGRIFGFMAFCESGLLKSTLVTVQDVNRIMDTLLEYSQAKAYLRIPCFHLMIQILTEIKSTELSDSVLDHACNQVLQHGIKSCEELWFTLVMQYDLEFSEFNYSEKLVHWHKGMPFHSKNLNRLVALLKESTFMTPIIHPVWESIISLCLKNKQVFLELWNALDDGLYNSTHERKYLGFWLFQKYLPLVETDTVSLLFTPSLMRCLMNNVSKKETYLYKMAKQTADLISKVAQDKSQITFDILLQLTGKDGSLFFDSISKTKTIESMIHNLTIEQISTFISRLESNFQFQGDEKNHKDSHKSMAVIRSRVLEQMSSLVKNPKIPREEGWVSDITKFLCLYSFYVKKQDSLSTPLDSKTRELCLEKLNGILSSQFVISGKKTSGQQCTRMALSFIESMNASQEYELLTSMDEDIKSVFKRAMDLIKSIEKRKNQTPQEAKTIEQLDCFEHLMTFLIIQGYSDPQDLVNNMDDLENCFQNLWIKQVKNSKKRKSLPLASKNSQESTETPAPIDVLLDVLIGLLSKSSASFRSLVVQVFKSMSNHFTLDSLDVIFDVLKTKEEVLDQHEEEEQHEEEDQHEEEEGDDSSSDDSIDSSDISLSDIIETETPNLDNDESLLGDDEMTAFDAKLAEILKQKKQEKASRKDLKRLTLHFKSRVVDLLEAYIQSESSNPLILDLLLKLVKSIFEVSDLQDRLGSVLKNKLLKSKECPLLQEIPQGKAIQVLKEIHSMASKAKDSSSLSICSSASLYVVRIFNTSVSAVEVDVSESVKDQGQQSKKKVKTMNSSLMKQDSSVSCPVSQVYKSSLADFMTKNKTNIKPSLFFELFNRYPKYSWQLLPDLVDLVSKKVNPKAYNLVQGYNMMARIIKQSNLKENEFKTKMSVLLPTLSRNFMDILDLNAQVTEGQHFINKDRLKDITKDLLIIFKKSKKNASLTETEMKSICQVSLVMESIESYLNTNSKLEKTSSMTQLLKEMNSLLS